MRQILIVLGSPNSESGELGAIARSRLDYCFNLYAPKTSVICTGGWGPHFNTTKHPHAQYAKSYLMQKGMPNSAFLEFALSKNTVEDATMSKDILSKAKDLFSLTIITSDYHLDRVKLIFMEILEGYSMKFVGAPNRVVGKKLDMLLSHEKKAIDGILKNGLYY